MKGNIKNIEITGIQAAVPCNEVDNMQYISREDVTRIGNVLLEHQIIELRNKSN